MIDIIIKFVCDHWIISIAVLAIIGLVLTSDDKLIDIKDIKALLKK